VGYDSPMRHIRDNILLVNPESPNFPSALVK
jgi:hypothetical protein